MPMRAWMSLIMDQIEPEQPELFALEFGKIGDSDFVYTLISTKLVQNVYDHKILDELDYGCSRTRTVQVIWP